MKKTILASLLAISTLTLTSALQAQENSEATIPEAAISLVEAIDIAQADHAGVTTSAALDLFEETPIYVVIIEDETNFNEVTIDGSNGDIIGEISYSAATPEMLDYLLNNEFGADDELSDEDIEAIMSCFADVDSDAPYLMDIDDLDGISDIEELEKLLDLDCEDTDVDTDTDTDTVSQ